MTLFAQILQKTDRHPVPFLIMGRVTYIHHYVRLPLRRFCHARSQPLQLPTLYFAVIMLAHLIDHFVFTTKRLTEKIKWIAFGVCVFILVSAFWWFKGLAFGMDGPINEHWGLQWRKVSGLLVTCATPRH